MLTAAFSPSLAAPWPRSPSRPHFVPPFCHVPRVQQVAVKKVLQDKRFKNRELQIMKMLDHANVTVLHYNFYSEGEKVTLAHWHKDGHCVENRHGNLG